MIRRILKPLLLISLFVTLVSAYASPTSNEFEKCHQLAVAVLDYCIKENISSPSASCWSNSEKQFNNCSHEVRRSHNQDSNEAKKKKAAMIKARIVSKG